MFNRVFAATVVPNTTATDIPSLIGNIITNFVLPLAGAVIMGMVVYGGFLYITSAGDSQKTEKAKKTLMWAILAVFIIVISYSIVVALNNVVNQEILK